jgi:mercuric ion transport protein
MQPVKQSWILTGGFLSALAASLCCIGPLLALAAGAGSFAAAGWFESWRPAFLAVTAALLAIAWVLTLRARRIACQDSTCTAPRGGRRTLGVLIFSTVLVGAVAMFPQIAQTAANRPLASTGTVVQGSALQVRIPSMDCAACAVGIEETLKRVPGVRSAVVRYANKEAEVVFDPATTSASALIAKIDATGFKAEPIN